MWSSFLDIWLGSEYTSGFGDIPCIFIYKKVVCLFFAFIDNISLSITQPFNDAKRGKNRYMADSLALNQI